MKKVRVPAPPIEGDLFPHESVRPDRQSGVLASPFRTDRTEALSRTLGFISGLTSENPERAIEVVTNAVRASAENDIAHNVQPPPSDIWAMMRMTEPLLRMNGDIWQTILVPAQILFGKKFKVSCRDAEAQKSWDRFYTEVLPINYWGRDAFFTVEQYGQWYPLEVWNDKDLLGIAALEPMSVWTGHHIGLGPARMELMSPDDGFSKEKLASMLHRSMYNSFSLDLNEQIFPAYRIPIKPDALRPVYALGKKAYQRYAIPHLARIFGDLMYRMMLKEYRQGVLEAYIQQIFMFIVKPWGTNNTVPKGAINAVMADVEKAIHDRASTLVFGWDVEPRIIRPERIDNVLATDAWNEATQTCFRGVGFDLFFSSGEIAGTHGRGGGVQVEVSVQTALERWEALLTGFFEWCEYLGMKWAALNDPSLTKFPPSLRIGPIGIKTQIAIEKRIKPLVTMGKLSDQTALEEAGYSYGEELDNKKDAEADAHFMLPQPTFAQTAWNANGEGETTLHANPGRPAGVAEDKSRAEAAIVLGARVGNDLARLIDDAFDTLLANPTRDAINGFTADLEMNLRTQMARAYEQGWNDYGGHGDLDTRLLNNLVQGVPFQVDRLRKFKRDLLASAGKPESVIAYRHRAHQYASSARIAYVLGTQAAMKQHGALRWQRMVHPEASASGVSCQFCIADSSVIHDISEPFTDHPDGNCDVAAVLYQFAHAEPITAQVPTVYRKGERMRRAPIGGRGQL